MSIFVRCVDKNGSEIAPELKAEPEYLPRVGEEVELQFDSVPGNPWIVFVVVKVRHRLYKNPRDPNVQVVILTLKALKGR